jgi:hypothetical protein
MLSADTQFATYATTSKSAASRAAYSGTDYVGGGSNLTFVGGIPYVNGQFTISEAGTFAWNSVDGTVSLTGVPPYGTSKGLFTMGAPPVGSSSSGTYLSINAASGFAGTLLRLQKNGANRFQVSEGGIAYLTPYQDNVSVLHITNALGAYRAVIGVFSSHSGYLDLYDGSGKNTVRLAGDGYPARFGVGAIVGPNNEATQAGTLSVLDRTALKGNTVLNVGHDGIGHTSPLSTRVSIRAGATQANTAPLQVEDNSGTAVFMVSSTGDGTARSMRLNPRGEEPPACGPANRGQIWQIYGGSGVADSVIVCAKSAADSYAWRAIF